MRWSERKKEKINLDIIIKRHKEMIFAMYTFPHAFIHV